MSDPRQELAQALSEVLNAGVDAIVRAAVDRALLEEAALFVAVHHEGSRHTREDVAAFLRTRAHERRTRP